MDKDHERKMWQSMYLVNRAAIVVRPKQPYIDWANGLEEGGPKLTLDDPNKEHTIYLVDDVEFDGDAEKRIKKYFPKIFEYELFAWHLRVEDWPAKRDLRTFRKWFSFEVHSMVQDLCDYEIGINLDVE